MNCFSWNLILALIWVAISGTLTGSNLVLGFVIGYAILGIALRHVPEFSLYVRRVPKIILFIGFFIRELIMSNLKVAYDVLTPKDYMHPGVIAVPLEAKTDAEITIVANLISMTPGTLSLDVSTDRQVIYIHVMYLDDRDAVQRHIKYFESRVLEILR